MKIKLTRIFLTLAVIIAGAAAFSAQTPTKKPLEEKLESKLMGRAMPYRVILPEKAAASKDGRYPVIYLLHGLGGRYDNWTEKTKLTEYAAQYPVIIVTPEGGDGWYTDSVSNASDKYESYIVKELIPAVDAKFKTIPERAHRAIAGLSMGGYGALKFGLKYPELFSLAGSFSGALGATDFTEKNAGSIGKGIDVVYGPEGSKTRLENDIFKLANELTPEAVAKLPFIYLDCGTEDFLYKSNRDFANILVQKKVPHEFRERPGKHEWAYWDSQVQEFLRLTTRTFK